LSENRSMLWIRNRPATSMSSNAMAWFYWGHTGTLPGTVAEMVDVWSDITAYGMRRADLEPQECFENLAFLRRIEQRADADALLALALRD
jgi:hypothetical protein